MAESAIDFFTSVGGRLLKSQSNLSLTRIQIYPTNQYSPEVHRVLQVTANLYDSTTNRSDTAYPYLPSVFRPIFTNDSGSIFIAGYVEETGTDFLSTPVRDLNNPADRAALQPDDCVYGVPLIIGAKKGFPNFNEFSMQSVVQVARRLELRRPNIFSRPHETNQMYVVGISNVFAVEAWNSYTNPFPRDLDLCVTNGLSIVLTNENGVIRSTNLTLRQIIPINIPANTWQGLVNPQVPQQSFRIPLLTNVIYLSDSVYSANPPYFRPMTAAFEQGVGFPVPQWGLIVSNRLRYTLADRATGRLVDYVSLTGLDVNLDIARTLFVTTNVYDEGSVMANQWLTNRPGDSASVFDPTLGILYQLEASLGNLAINLGDWNSYSLQAVSGLDKNKAIDAFRVFMGRSPISYPATVNTNLVQQAPFTPSRKIYQNISWQANDPLVHYTLNELTGLVLTNDVNFIVPPKQPVPSVPNLAKINTRYQPWGGNPNKSPDTNAFNVALKDPLMKRSDDWDFPENEPLKISSIGRVHRGTPWQTIYLKSPDVDLLDWQKWTGIADGQGAQLTRPMNDWRLINLFASLLNTNAPHNLFSINQTNVASWAGVLSGIQVLTNTLTDAELNMLQPSPQFDSLIMQSNSPQTALIADAIAYARSIQPNQYFREVGDILATPELSVASPWLNRSSAVQLMKGITDEAYEIIPEQILSLLRPDSVGSIGWTNDQIQIQFTGFDGYLYAVESYPAEVARSILGTGIENEKRIVTAYVLKPPGRELFVSLWPWPKPPE